MKLDRVIAVRNNKTVFRDGKHCVKIFSVDFQKSRVFAEALNHALVEECIDFVPKLLEVIRHDRSWAIVYDFIKGKTLLQWMEEEPEALSDQVEYFVDTQIRLHTTEGGRLASMKKAFASSIDKAPLDAEGKAALHKGLEEMSFSSRLCHADFVPSNLIIGEDTRPVVLDWACALSGEPLADAAITYLLMKIRGFSDFAEQYQSQYIHKTHRCSEDWKRWLPYAAVFLLNYTNAAEREMLLPYAVSMKGKGETT